MTDLCDLTLTEAGKLVRQRAITLPELVTACLERAAATQSLNAFSDLYASRALTLAAAFQTLLEAGHDLGPLHGMPVALKANIALAGERMTAGSAILRDHVATADADVTRRLKQAGAIILGATNMHEFAWGGTTTNPHYGQCRNPWAPDRIPAGSSGGSGAAVAAGSVPAALGTDTGGSVRLPASMNGITGLRPGVGRISTEGVFPLAWSMDTVGPMARSSADCAHLFAALAGADGAALAATLERPLAGLRAGVPEPYASSALQDDVGSAFAGFLATLTALGVTVEPVSLPGLEAAVDAQVIVDAAEPSAVHARWIAERPDDYGADVRVLLQAGLSFTAVEYLQAQRYRTWLRRESEALLARFDVLVTPTLPFTAPRIGQETILIGGREESTLTGNMRFTCLPSLTALPAISLPAGFDRDGLPVGVQVMAGAQGEALLLRFGHQVQQATGHHARRPALTLPVAA
ncbi:amidase [Pseudoxanthobacter sp.]|uniref:amidase n=1 Tax=Pseudoxanthobacter sp. TaxID=1925742 RepID=UPI002FDF1F8E